MRPLLLVPALALAATSATLHQRQQPSTGCEDVHLFLSRGAGDTYPGTQGPLVDAICGGLPSCDYEDVLYVGTFDRVCESVTTGVVNATAQITSYAERCPEAKMVLCGHSEGASVILNTIGGGEAACPGGTMPTSEPMDPGSAPGNQIAAVAITGDLRHTASQPYNVGTGADANGIWPRSAGELAGLTAWEDKIRSWCTAEDPVCAGGADVGAHGVYMEQKEEIASWVKEVLGV